MTAAPPARASPGLAVGKTIAVLVAGGSVDTATSYAALGAALIPL